MQPVAREYPQPEGFIPWFDRLSAYFKYRKERKEFRQKEADQIESVVELWK